MIHRVESLPAAALLNALRQRLLDAKVGRYEAVLAYYALRQRFPCGTPPMTPHDFLAEVILQQLRALADGEDSAALPLDPDWMMVGGHIATDVHTRRWVAWLLREADHAPVDGDVRRPGATSERVPRPDSSG